MKKDVRGSFSVIMGIVLLVCVWSAMGKGYAYAGLKSPTASSFVSEQEEDCGRDLTGYTVVIDPGHGGVDPGMLGVDNTIEKEINLTISYILKEKLESLGITVILTRENDEGLYSENDKNKKIADMKKRCQIIEESKADLVVSIHQNSFSDSSVSGAQVFYYTHSEEGKRLAQCIQDSIRINVDDTNTRKIKANDSYYMLIHTPCPAVIVECGFITNYDEARLLTDADYQQKIADAIAQGMGDFLDK